MECGVWSVKCGVRSVEFEFVNCRVWGVECSV